MSGEWNFEGLLSGIAKRGDAPALIAVRNGTLEILSGQDLADRARAAARRLLRDGTASAEPIALTGSNGFAWVIARFAVALAGAVAVAIDELADDAELARQLAKCKSSRIICPSQRSESLRRSHPKLLVLILEDLVNGAQAVRLSQDAGLQDVGAPSSHPPDMIAMLAFTSGTTGAPKAIVLSNANIASNVRALVDCHIVGRGDRILLPLPLHHVYPLVVGLLVPLASGATVVFPESVTGPQLLEAARLANVRAIVGVPRLYSALCSGLMSSAQAQGGFCSRMFRLLLGISIAIRKKSGVNVGRILFGAIRNRFGRNLHLLVSGGARLDFENLWTLLGLGFDVRSGYGLAETSSTFTANTPGNERWGSEGKPIAGRVRIAAADPSGIGQIELQGPQVFSRYLDNPEATAAAFTDDGWYRAGDLGRLDRDGFLHVAGRATETLVLGGGKKVDPESLERIYGSSKYIREIAVLVRNGALVAIVVPSLDAVRSGGAVHIDTAIRVELASCTRTLPSWQRLAGFAIAREPLPRTRLGKYRRFLLPAIYDRALRPPVAGQALALSAEDEALLQQPVAREIYELLRKRYPNAQLGLDASPLLDLGLDSLEWIAFGLALEDQFHLRLTEEDIAGIVTIRDLLIRATRVAASAPAPSPVASVDWTSKPPFWLRRLGETIYAVSWLGMRVLFRLRVRGRAPGLDRGPYIFMANHASYLDACVIAAALPYRTIRHCWWSGDAHLLFRKAWQRPLMRAMQVYPMDERAPLRAIAMSRGLLERGESVVWFPEGWRSPDGTLQPFLPGIGRLLEQFPVTVVPLCIDGTFEAFPRDKRFPKLRPVRLVIGEPVEPAAWHSLLSEKSEPEQRIAAFLREAVLSLKSVAAKEA